VAGFAFSRDTIFSNVPSGAFGTFSFNRKETMKKTYRFSISFTLVASLLLSACNNFLEVQPISVASEAAFYKTSQDAIVATNGCYNALIEIYRNTTGNTSIWLFSEVMADDATDPELSVDNFTFDAASGNVETLWRLHYIGIARCNTLIGRIEGIPMEETLKTRLQLEARYLRAYYYFNLVRLYGDVPLILQEVKGQDIPFPTRTLANEVYQQIIADLTAAEALPVSYPASETGRATRGAAKALLAKVYLTQRNWQQAATKAREVMDLGVYQLLPNYADVFLAQNRNSAESIFEVQFGRGGQVGTGNPVTSFFFQQFAPQGSGAIVTGIANSNGEGRMIPTNEFVNAYEPNDPRREASVRTFYVRTTDNRRDTVRINYTIKYQDAQATAGGGLASGNGSENGWRVIRYTDVLLMYAEALNELGDGNPQALDAVNQVRRRARGTSPATVLPDLIGLNQAALRDAIYKERRVELNFEGHRWFDLLRTERALDVMRQTKNIQPRNLLLPIPQRERDVNQNLSQNTGY
jgi:starch-binding outer membrane protein, SusD/RagB family